MDKGFELMIPRPAEEEVKEDYEYKVKFTFFKKEFVIRLSIKSK